ncbi:hypothetical protein TNCV_5034001 [Trichonephila clavipes]|nr:hypothetical protein TNCV_5034001 [Trichonephila clavipes]
MYAKLLGKTGCSHVRLPMPVLTIVGLSSRCECDITTRGRVSDRKCVLIRMDDFRATRNVSKEMKGSPKAARTSENVERIRVSIQIGM